MAEKKRSYDDPCGVARALDVIGERWALLVVRELLLGPKRFTDLTDGLPGLSPNVLSQRLRDLEGDGVVRRRMLGPPARSRVYELTERGAALEPLLIELARWGSRVPLDTTGDLSVDALALALKTTFDPVAAAGLSARYALRLGDDELHAEIRDGAFTIARARAARPDATITTDARTFRGLVFGGRHLGEAERDGDVTVEGDHDAVATLVTSFPRPQAVDEPVSRAASGG